MVEAGSIFYIKATVRCDAAGVGMIVSLLENMTEVVLSYMNKV